MGKEDKSWCLLVGITTLQLADDGDRVLFLRYMLESIPRRQGWPDDAVMAILPRHG